MLMQNIGDNNNNNMNANTNDSVNNNEGDDNSQSGDVELDRNGQHHPVAEFLYQLTKMLTDDNSEIIEWVDGRIKVHHPERLEAEVLHKYFRHSKFASFQRQLNYFGFRKIAGKGKMSPCSYVNDAATSDIRSLLLIKRKTNGSAARKAAMQQRAAALNLGNFPFSALAANPAAMAAAATLNPQALTSAMALLSDSALRNGFLQQVSSGQSQSTQLGLLALQQQQLQQQQQQQQQLQHQNLLSQSLQAQQRSSETTSDHHQQALQHQQQLQQLQQRFQQGLNKSQSGVGQSGMGAPAPTSGSLDTSNFGSSSAPQPAPAGGTPSLEQLHANLTASLAGQLGGNFGGFGSLPSNIGSANAPSAGSASAALANATRQSSDNPATAALQSMSATAAVNAASDAAAAPAVGGSIFESALNLESLLQEYQANETRQQQEQERQRKNLAGSFNNASQVLMNRLPSSGTIFPSTASFGNMGNMGIGSSNRLSSLLSLSSLVNSREASLADLAAQLPGNSRVAAGLQSTFGAPMDANNRFRN